MTSKVVMGIDTSCDETSVGFVSLSGRMLANVVSSQAQMYATLGGVVPEMAAREHLARLREVYRLALQQAKISKDDIAGIAVTRGPGLSGCLAVGMAYAKGMGMGLGVSVVGVDHLEGHIHSAFLAYPDLKPPFGYLIASGGHTLLGVFEEGGKVTPLGESIDDAAGEALDKGARLLGLPYPGGPVLDRIGMEAQRPLGVSFPKPRVPGKPLVFSFSGLKTALAFYLEHRKNGLGQEGMEAVAAAYLDAVLESLILRIIRALELFHLQAFVVCGGVAASRRLRQLLTERVAYKGLSVRVLFPPYELCTDNGAMIARAGLGPLLAGEDHTESLDIPS